MKTKSSSTERSKGARDFGILDTLVVMLAAALFAAWILGTLFVHFFPAATPTNADSPTIAMVDGDDEAQEYPGTNGVQGSNGETTSADDAGNSNLTNAAGGDSGFTQSEAGDGLAKEEKTALQNKISALQKQLDAKSKELVLLRKTKIKPATPAADASVDHSKFEKQISQLKREKGLLDREIKRLNGQSDNQKTKIQALQDQLVKITQAKSIAEPTDARGDAEKDLAALDGASPKQQPLEFRDWISSKGNKARLAFVRWEDGKIIVVNEANKKFRLSLNRLSPEDQKYVNDKR